MVPAVSSAVFLKLSKHLGLLVCFLILGRASGRFAISPAAIFGFAAAAALAHMTARGLQFRFVRKIFRSGFQ
jgi:hypothetical protein